MAKTIRITFYNPKELWHMFWIKFFWPRRKQCTQWCDYFDDLICSEVVNILLDENEKGAISDEVANRLGLSIKSASNNTAKRVAKLMSEPLYDCP